MRPDSVDGPESRPHPGDAGTRIGSRWRRRRPPPSEGFVGGAADRPQAHAADRDDGDGPESPFAPRPGSGPGPTEARGEPMAIDPVVVVRLRPVLEMLDHASIEDAAGVLAPLAKALEPDETVRSVVQGWARGLPCVVARTDGSVLVVVQRFPDPLVERLDPSELQVFLYGPPHADRVALAVVDRQRVLEVTGIRDRSQARSLAGVAADVPGPARREPVTDHF